MGFVRVITAQDLSSPRGGLSERFDLEVPDSCTLRVLIRLRVREEVARHNATPSGTFRGLGCAVAAMPRDDVTQVELERSRVDWEQQADVAERAFLRNGFFVFVGDTQFDELDQVVPLRTDDEVRFVRLVSLVGG